MDGNIVSGANSLEPDVDEAGTYTLTVTNDDNGCTASDIVTITNNMVVANAGTAPIAECQSTNYLTADVPADADISAGADVAALLTSPDKQNTVKPPVNRSHKRSTYM